MGYCWCTDVRCTNPDLISSGSTFNKKCEEFILSIESGTSKYYCIGQDFNDALFQYSREYPRETFTGVTWNDSDYYDCIKFTLVIKNGEYKQVKCEPCYLYGLRMNGYEIPKGLFERFKKHLKRYIERIDLVHPDPIKGEVFDFLNDKEDQDGFRLYYTITWENDKHKFTATKRFISFIMVEYQKKDSEQNKITHTDNGMTNCNQDESDDGLPF